MDIYSLIISISTMTLMILAGLLIELRFKTSEQIKSIFIFIVINIAIPSVIVNGFFTTSLSQAQFLDLSTIFIISISFNLIGILVSFLIYRLLQNPYDISKQKTLISGVGNTGFIGIPLSFSMFGPIGGVYASFYDTGTILVVFSVGLLILQSNPGQLLSSSKNVINPPIIALVGCIALRFADIDIPLVLTELTGHLSSLSAPLAMFYVGFILPKAYKLFKENKHFRDTLLPISLRLLILPIIFMLITANLDFSEEVKRIIVIQTAMPSILLAPIFFKRYGYDEGFGTIAVIYATLLSMITIPIVAVISNFIIFN